MNNEAFNITFAHAEHVSENERNRYEFESTYVYLYFRNEIEPELTLIAFC